VRRPVPRHIARAAPKSSGADRQRAQLEGWLYLAAVLDVFLRRVVAGGGVANDLLAPVVCDAVGRAVLTRGGYVVGVLFRSDRLPVHKSIAFGQPSRESEMDVRPSIGSAGRPG
jgi:transposase InsO family protein